MSSTYLLVFEFNVVVDSGEMKSYVRNMLHTATDSVGKLQSFCYYTTCHFAKIIRIFVTEFFKWSVQLPYFYRLISIIHLA